MNPLAILGGALGALMLLIGAYVAGRHDGRDIQVGKQAAVEKAVEKEQAKRQDGVDAGATAARGADIQRQAKVREIFHETNTVTERPVYRNVCADDDGVRILDRAAEVANGAGLSIGDGGATAAPESAAIGGRDADGKPGAQ